MVLLWGWRWAEQGRARMLVENAQITTAPVKRMALEPYPINPFHWHAILETEAYYQTAEVNTLTGEIASDPRWSDLQAAHDRGHGGRQAQLSRAGLSGLGHVGRRCATLARWQRPGWPRSAQLPPDRLWTTVEFTDLRFDYSVLG